jgi:hypothetical protein
MSKSTKKLSSQSARTKVNSTKASSQAALDPDQSKKGDAGSKQSRVIAMLQSPTGVTIAAIMKATGWQQHSVRGFLAGVVRKRLKLKLASKKVDGNRVYQVPGGTSSRPKVGSSKRQSS